MWDYVGIVRSKKRLQLATRQLAPILAETKEHFHDYLLTPDLVELRNIVLIAELIIYSASLRHESRGLHYITDFPEKDDAQFGQDTVIEKNSGSM